jgi:integrase/recombinase XerD
MRRPARCLRARMWCRAMVCDDACVPHHARIRRPVTPHVLRHTFSVTAIQKGISLPALQRLLGHDHLATTEIYLNLSPEEVVREFREKW